MSATAAYPALTMSCPTCGARAGQDCRTKSGGAYQGFHHPRGDLARANAKGAAK